MSVVSTHVGANLRFTGDDGGSVLSFRNARPAINAGNVESIMEGIELIRQQPVAGARLTVTTELAEA